MDLFKVETKDRDIYLKYVLASNLKVDYMT